MLNLENVINHHNAATAIRYLLNLDSNALNEKTIKIGITNLIDIKNVKGLFCTMAFKNDPVSLKNENLVKSTINLIKALNEEAKASLLEHLAINKIFIGKN